MLDQDFKQTEKPKTNEKELGKSGTLVTGGVVQSDYLATLIGVEGQETYNKMLLSDSQIRKLVHAVNNPIKSATWDVEPASEDEKDLEVAALIKQILFEDLPDGWKGKLDEILTFPWLGHAVFEVVHKNRIDKKIGPYTGLENIAFRDQRTLDKWNFSASGILESIHQIQSGTVEVNVDMPTDTLLIFYNEKKGNDTGYPFCRMLYGNYKRKLLYKQLQAIGIEKGAIGVPVLKLPMGISYDSEEYQEAVDQLTAYTQAESAHIILPDGYELNLDQSNTFDPAKVQVAIKAENEEISGSLVAMWLEMGIGGNSAVGSSTGISSDFFRDGIEYIADKIADPVNRNLIPQLVRMNYGDTIEVMPKLVHSGIADEAGKELMEVVTGYTKANVITPDEQLEDHIRKAHNLPKKAEGELMDNGKAKEKTKEELPKEEVELSSKKKTKTTANLIESQAEIISEHIRDALEFSSAKYINDVMKKYKQLSASRKQNATSKIKVGGINNLKKDLRRSLTETVAKAIDMARNEVPTKKDIELSNQEKDMIRMVDKFGDSINEIKLNEISKMPAHIQVLIAKQSELISEASLTELRERIDFSFSSIETKSNDERIIRQSMEEEADKFIQSNQVNIKGSNVSALVVNEGRETFFFNDDVLDEIHSFTFVNFSPKSAICKELAGTTFNTNDAESLRYTPPLHHNAVLSGTLIETATGKKEIQDIVVGEKVRTHTGKFHSVYDVMDRFEDKHYFEIELDNGKKISITAEHPILTDRGWKRVDELLLEDNIICLEDIIDA